MSKYYFFSRFSPTLFLLLPAIIVEVSYGKNFESFPNFIFIVIFLIGLAFILSAIDKDFGKKKEKELWIKWGGAPIALLLNYDNSFIDQDDKDKYHATLLKFLPSSKEINFKSLSISERNHIYLWWGMYLIKHIPNDIDNSLLLDENIRYGFKRHLWGYKSMAVNIVAIFLIGNFLFYLISNDFDLSKLPYNFYISELLLIILLIIWSLFVNSDWVKSSAFTYTKRLLECTEDL